MKKALSTFGNDLSPFGGQGTENSLKKYHYKMMMPYITDPVDLNKFESFENGLATNR